MSLQPTDIELLSGHVGNNLRFNGKPSESKTWSDMLAHAEEYEDFLKRFEKDNKHLFNVCFKNSSIDRKIIERMLENINRTAYQLSYSPDVFVPRTEKRRFAKLKNQDGLHYEETTHGTYFNSIENIKRFKEILQSTKLRENTVKRSKKFKKCLFCSRSTYHDEIAVLGKVYAKPTLPEPIDRYTLRKV